ncbi:N-acyl-D-amino-acid deacylase family protein [Eisenibacter elegans]|jgi:N-acyl-D-aspartate/D-glutamate deacylase|uniref:N-acyl-D-amino-acid deacylase family protein n=1 Tax=Eisenibacter elegans TaxID=997 RepID=UPI000423C2C1|nr:amidohydrolase family protein [Eisenibacter elegans]
MSKTSTLIQNGIYFDGLGNPGRKADLLIKDGKVAQVADYIPPPEGVNILKADGLWVTPGFLDIHTHYDAEVEVLPGLEESVRHGVTTVVFGNCSLSSAVGTEDDIINLFSRVENMPTDILQSWVRNKITWKTTREYYEHLDSLPVGPNIATFIGHSNLRIATMGLERSLTIHKANKAEIEKMKGTVQEAMEAGYLGLSIDMLPLHRMALGEFKGVSVPSQQAHFSEYIKLASVVRKYNRVLQATPNALDKRSAALLFLMSMGVFRKRLSTTIVAALDVKSDPKIHKVATGLATVFNNVFRTDVRWQALAEPFLNYADGAISPLFEEFPSAAKAIGMNSEERKAMYADPSFREWFKKDWNHKGPAVFHRRLDDMWVVKSPETGQEGRSVADLAAERKQDPLDFFMDMVAKYDQDFRWKSAVANHREEKRIKLLAHKTTIPGFNDSGAHNVNMAFYDGSLQTLKQAQKYPHVMSIETAIHRMTKMAADWLGIDAGALRVGDRADLAILDPTQLASGLSEPIEHHDPRLGGTMRLVKRSDKVMKHVMVKGELLFSEGQFAQDLGQRQYGQLLRSTRR